MRLSRVIQWLALALSLSILCSAMAAVPLVQFEFEQSLRNTGSLGGTGEFKTYGKGETPLFDRGPLAACLDLTTASRYGGEAANDAPAGGAVLYQHEALSRLETFTVVLWARRNPAPSGQNARLLTKGNAWDLMPTSRGFSLGLTDDKGKTRYSLAAKTNVVAETDWHCLMIVVAPSVVRGYLGGMTGDLVALGETERRTGPLVAAQAIELGNFNGIRPFNGWLDNVRIYAQALTEAEARAIYAADVAAKRSVTSPLVYDLGYLPFAARRYHFQATDIPFSTRWERTNAVDVMKSFHASQCVWVYGSSRKYIESVHAAGAGFEGALNGLQGLELATTNRFAKGDTSGRHEDLDGNKNMPSWMVTFGSRHFTGCCNSPAFRAIFFKAAKAYLDAGVDLLHVDDWAMNASWSRNAGVCFCEDCRAGFREYLRQRCSPEELKRLGVLNPATFDYREHLKQNGVPDAATYRQKFRALPLTPLFIDFQVQSTRAFYQAFRKQLDQWSPQRYIPISFNAMLSRTSSEDDLFASDLADFYVGEMYFSQSFAAHLLAGKASEAAAIPQFVSPMPRHDAPTQSAIATMYGLGSWHLVPWDIYMGSDATGIQPRYFGTREKYGALYDFIHDRSSLFTGYQSVAEIGVLYNADLPGGPELMEYCQKLAERQIQFRLLVAVKRFKRMPLHAEDFKGLRAVVEFSPADSFDEEDQKVVRQIRTGGAARFFEAEAALIKLPHFQDLDLCRVEGPDHIYALVRVNPGPRSAVIHLLNWNAKPDNASNETYRHVTLTLKQLERWGPISTAVYHQPGAPVAKLELERHGDSIRLTVPELATWGAIELKTVATGK